MKNLFSKTWVKAASISVLLAVSAITILPMAAFADTITLDGTVITANNTASLSITVASNTNRMGLVCFTTYQGGAPSGVTWGGSAMTKVAEMIGSFGENASVWAILAPTVGSDTVTVTGGADWRGFGAYSLYGVDQNIPSVFTTGGGDSGTASLAITTDTANAWVLGCIESEPVPTMTTSGGTSDYVLEGQSFQHGSAQHIAKAVAGSQTMSASLSYGARWNQVDVQIKPAAGGGGGGTVAIDTSKDFFLLF